MNREERRRLLLDAGYNPSFVDEILASDEVVEQAEVSPELVRQTVDYALRAARDRRKKS